MLYFWHTSGTPPREDVIALLSAIESALEEMKSASRSRLPIAKQG
jgi:hypothetical protein